MSHSGSDSTSCLTNQARRKRKKEKEKENPSVLHSINLKDQGRGQRSPTRRVSALVSRSLSLSFSLPYSSSRACLKIQDGVLSHHVYILCAHWLMFFICRWLIGLREKRDAAATDTYLANPILPKELLEGVLVINIDECVVVSLPFLPLSIIILSSVGSAYALRVKLGIYTLLEQ